MKVYKPCWPGICLVLLFWASPGWSACTNKAAGQTEDDRTAIIAFGKVNLSDAYLVPVGSLLASVVVPPTNYNYGGATGSTVLWECDKADLSHIFFLVATNGDDRVGGYHDIGGVDGLTGVYATWFAYVGLRQTMAGVTLSRYWQKVQIPSWAETDKGKIQIRLQDIPPLQAELYRISSKPGDGKSNYCGTDDNGLGFATPTGKTYTCVQPNSYIQLSGDSTTVVPFAHDLPGEDSATHFDFWGVDNGFGYGMRTGSTLYSNSTCVARSADPLVLLPPISVNDLNNGLTSSARFSVQVECSDAAQSGVGDTQTAMGFQVSEGAFSAAKTLGLVNASGGVSALVSDNYFANGVAKGVGITLAHSSAPGAPLTLLGQPAATAGGAAAGWYPVMQGATKAGSALNGYSHYTYSLIATLKKLNDTQNVTAGKVKATAYVVVKMQ
ncbi:TPA: fimbrial protein [Pluralibacter gergoviae]|uniref:Adhesin n=2 Tax=Pluralibacter gergoviae TaxID=61647 RepID=A0A0J5KYD7_PLUGE|nr:fimbrial protein [Pluralibacter gergoviae]KMK11540.1 adhesin [Pluralibacter gergoviae]KMK21336.1 adhesin [Pluralibacter gergoviae]HDS1150521.1 fimbrial protein [Pluralibacter gergoviae]